MNKNLSLMSCAALVFSMAVFLSPGLLCAQKTTLQTQGVAGDMDKDGRSPALTVSTVVSQNNVQILADAYVIHPEYRQYPLRFDFFINRRLFSSQIRSPELPGAVGVDIGPDIASPPFNYSVVVDMVHPNRSFTSSLSGAVFSTVLTGVFDCTLTLGSGDDASLFVGNDVETYQSGNDAFSLSFEGKSEDGDETVDVVGVVTTNGEAAKSDLQITRAGIAQIISTSGTVEVDEDGKIQSFDLSSEDGETQLSCS